MSADAVSRERPVIVVAAVAFVRDGRVLTVRKRGTSKFMLVGGKLEPGESAHDAAVREAWEEVQVRVTDARLLGEFEGETANEPDHRLHSTTFLATLTSKPVAAAEIEELRWVGVDDDGDDLAPMLRTQVLPLLRNGEATVGDAP